MSHIDSVEMYCVARERGWRRNTDLEVLRASGVGEVMGTDEFIPETCEFWIVQGQFLISGRFFCFLFSVFTGNTN